MAYDNNNSGMLGKNERKTTANHPDYTGQCEINGVKFWVSAWIKDGKPGGKMEGKKFFSLSFKPQDAAKATNGATAAPFEDPLASKPTPAPARAAAQAPIGKVAGDPDDDTSVPF